MGYKEIYERYTQSILSGSLSPGERVPSIRLLAADLGVAKKTVESAYDLLVGEGYLVSRGAKGTVVNPGLHIQAPTRQEGPAHSQETPLTHSTETGQSGGYLRLGIPSLDAFPYRKWLSLSGKAVRSMRPEEMLSPPVAGYAPLREAIANYVNLSRGLKCSADQVFITSGYKHSLALTLQAITTETDTVLFEEPGYFLGRKLLSRLAPNLAYVPVDAQGMDVDYLARHHPDAKLVITTPAHQSPLAVTLSLPRRSQLLQWARTSSGWILEDDYDGEFHYTRKVIPSLKSLDKEDRVIYVGTFSKTVMPSIRVSYLVVPRALISTFQAVADVVATGLALLPQKTLSLFLAEGQFFKHLKKMRSLYQARREMVCTALRTVYPNLFEVEMTDGGMHIVAFLKTGTQDEALASLWQVYDLRVAPLSLWYAQAPRRYGLVIGYTNVPSLEEALRLFRLPYKETVALLAMTQTQ
ncbi:PLP-dependent aminotransferase family protein [Marinimicrobium locisalis]|uniref:MocR-like pyridoxine biosynthesis transcription factor PdxR n=1 Tax=Marinimicrobium locisalis TaxID=546022 RepID=UPI003221F1B1